MVPAAAAAPPPADEMYIRVPVPPEVVRGVRKHVDAFAELLESARTLDGSAKAIGSLVDRVLQAGAELDTDIRRAQRALDGRRRASGR